MISDFFFLFSFASDIVSYAPGFRNLLSVLKMYFLPCAYSIFSQKSWQALVIYASSYIKIIIIIIIFC